MQLPTKMKIILLTQGQKALVDDEDYEVLSQHRWYAFYNNSNGKYYAARMVSGRVRFMHTEIMGGLEVDHKNHDGLDNQRHNLELVTRSQNQLNRPGPNRNTTTGVRNVTYNKRNRVYYAQVMHNYVNHVRGPFNTLEEATEAAESLRNALR